MQEAYEYAEYGDVDLLRLISQGDKAAFDILYRRHWEFLYLSAFRVLKDRETCMDVLQEVFIWLWEHREDCRIVRVRPYLHAAVKYKITNYIHKMRPAAFSEISELQQNLAVDHSDIEFQELKQVIDRFAGELPGRCREIFHLSRYQYLSNREIAAKLGISEKTVENQITIALRRLRTTLKHMPFWLFFFV